MNEEPTRREEEEEEREEEEQAVYPLTHSAAFAGSTLVTMGFVDLVAHLGPTGLLISGLASYVAWKHGPELYAYAREKFAVSQEPSSEAPETAQQPRSSKPKRSLLDRALGRFPEPVEKEEEDELVLKEAREEDAFPLDSQEAEWLPRSAQAGGPFLFSAVLDRFHPTLERIFLARTESGLDLFCSARDLCHVALAGHTGGGKSTIMRLLMLQLCSVEVRVLLLNPHYTRYDLDTGEDWTPFEPYLVHPPLECRSYQVIEHYLKSTSKELIPRRLERRAHSQPVGKPYFLVLDELPSIVREIEAAPEYLRIILQEGRKVGVFLISAAHDFLVKTIAPKTGGGAIRECYRTAYYLGGDPTTARILLDMPASLIPEDQLGRGVAMLRGGSLKKAALVSVPYVENAALYRLLGPSTYQASRRMQGNLADLDFPPISPVSPQGKVETAGNDLGNGVEMAREADQDTVTRGAFPVSTRPSEMARTSVKAAVSPDKLEMIKRMKEKHFQDHEIASLVGLAGRKYGLYREALVALGYAKAKEE